MSTPELAYAAVQAATVDPNATVERLRVVAVSILTLVLVVVSVVGVVSAGRKGNVSKSWNISASVLICLIPAFIAGAGALFVASSIYGWFGLGG